MQDQAQHNERLLPPGYSQCRQWNHPARKRLSSFKSLVARMAHDLRIPLAAILANAEFLTQSNLRKNERDELYEEIRSSIVRMNELISDLLNCSKGSRPVRPAIGNIVETTERAMRMVSARPAFRRISITHRHEGSAIGWYDSSLMERVVANVLLNACEVVSPESGQVAITTLGGPTCLRIEVWDNGPGIPAAIQSSVFQPFFTYGKSNGIGLGLAIAKRIVEDHGGELFLDARKRTGTSFKITMPFAIPEGISGGHRAAATGPLCKPYIGTLPVQCPSEEQI